MVTPVIIAIDGPSASGKGTIARQLAAQLGFAYLDTGLLYRAVGFAVMSAGGDPADPELAEQAALALALRLSGNHPAMGVAPPESRPQAIIAAIDFARLMNDDVLRAEEASVAASKVAAVPAVRAALLKFQKDFCANPPGGVGGAVLDGRDIGTVIAPHARVKIFVTASTEVRAQRRFKELQGRGLAAHYVGVLADLKERDVRDAERAIAPTVPAFDAILLDTTELNSDEALKRALQITAAAGF
jgi:cytidylate kinase